MTAQERWQSQEHARRSALLGSEDRALEWESMVDDNCVDNKVGRDQVLSLMADAFRQGLLETEFQRRILLARLARIRENQCSTQL